MRMHLYELGAVGPLDSVEAESKRSGFTIREVLSTETDGVRLWTPTSVVLGENRVRVLTSEGSLELRPRRLVWTEPNSFRVTGLSRGLAFRRSYLRFKSPEERLGPRRSSGRIPQLWKCRGSRSRSSPCKSD